jgi:hypothetical protein
MSVATSTGRAAAELFENSQAFVLAFIGMNGRGGESGGGELADDAIGAVFRATEDDAAGWYQPIDQVDQGTNLLFLGNDGDGLGDKFCGFLFGFDGDADGIREHGVGEFADFRLHGCGKHERLSGFGNLLQDSADGGEETHIEHAVGFVEDEHFDAVERAVALLHQIKESAWGGHEDINAGLQSAGLGSWPTPP